VAMELVNDKKKTDKRQKKRSESLKLNKTK